MTIEDERKFLLNPTQGQYLDEVSYAEYIHQRYIITGESELRIRKIHSTKPEMTCFMLTVKKGRGKVRQEFDTMIPESLYNEMVHEFPSTSLYKMRMYGKVNDMDACIEFYPQFRFLTMEVETSPTQKCDDFIIPEFVSKEVTYDATFKAQHLWEQLNTKGVM